MDIHHIFFILKTHYLFISAVIISIFLAWISHWLIYRLINKHYPNPQNAIKIFFKHLNGPLYIIFPLLYIAIFSAFLDFSATSYVMSLIVKILFVIAIGWSALQLVDYFDIWLSRRHEDKNSSYVEMLKKIHLAKKIAKIVIFILGISLLLLSFESFREIGKGMILSAGVIGAVLILAAQKLFGNIIAGFQLAFFTPIQIGDMVKIGGEVGTVEEVTLTYIIVRTWDLKKLVVPLSHLMEKPFENWTQLEDGLLGTVLFYTDYYAKADTLRETLMSILKSTDLWNKKVAKLEVTNVTEKSMEFRALFSANDSGALWNLQCYVREKLMAFIAKEYSHNIPKIFYTEIDSPYK